MTAALALRVDGDRVGLQVSDTGPTVRLRRRGSTEALDAEVRGGCAWFPASALAGDGVRRWDALCVAADGAETQLRPAPADGGPRHFLRADVGPYAVSAYLSDSAGSLVLLCAPAERHRVLVESEDARAEFPRWLQALPLQPDLVLFESFLGRQYAGNPRYIYEALRERRPDLRCVWAYNGTASIPGDPPRVVRGSPEYLRVLATAGFRVNNVRFTEPGRKAQTRYLQTWHGTPLKRLGYDIDVAGPEMEARESFHRESRGWTCLLSANPYSTATLSRAFRYDGPVLEAGYPLTDPLLDTRLDRLELVRRLGLSEGRRFILYAPTWRDDRRIAAWRFAFDSPLDMDAVSAALEPDQVLLVKAHHLVSHGPRADALPSNIVDVSHVEDATDLCALADVLVTDYSSIFFDFAVTGRPILFYCYDLEHYTRRVRGFYLDPEAGLPGPMARTTGELIALIADLPGVQARYAQPYAAFRDRYCPRADGASARRVVDDFFGRAPVSGMTPIQPGSNQETACA